MNYDLFMQGVVGCIVLFLCVWLQCSSQVEMLHEVQEEVWHVGLVSRLHGRNRLEGQCPSLGLTVDQWLRQCGTRAGGTQDATVCFRAAPRGMWLQLIERFWPEVIASLSV